MEKKIRVVPFARNVVLLHEGGLSFVFVLFPLCPFSAGTREREECVSSTLHVSNRVLLQFKREKSSVKFLLFLSLFFSNKKTFYCNFSVFLFFFYAR